MPSLKTFSRALEQLIEMQRISFLDATNFEHTPTARAQCMRAWEVLEERKRILRSKPLPGSLRPTDSTPKRFAQRKAQHANAQNAEALAKQFAQDTHVSQDIGDLHPISLEVG